MYLCTCVCVVYSTARAARRVRPGGELPRLPGQLRPPHAPALRKQPLAAMPGRDKSATIEARQEGGAMLRQHYEDHFLALIQNAKPIEVKSGAQGGSKSSSQPKK